MIRRLPLLLAALIPGLAMGQQQACGRLENAYGPFDYRTGKAKLAIVEQYHFTPHVESLKGGATGSLGGDLDYTLRASPNHHRALYSVATLALNTKTSHPRGTSYTVDCYFDRALRFAPDDGVVRIIQGVYLSRAGRNADAVRVLEEAKTYEPDNPNLYYNLGLAYFELKNYPKSLENAHAAYRLGAAFPGLRDKLRAAKQWKDPADDDRSAAAKPSAPAPAPR